MSRLPSICFYGPAIRQTAPLTDVTAGLVKAHGTALLQTLETDGSLRMAACVMKWDNMEPSESITVKSDSLTYLMITRVLHIVWGLTGVLVVDGKVPVAHLAQRSWV